MKLTKRVSDYIKNSSDYIDDNNFSYLYNDMWALIIAKKFNPEDIGEFTTALLDADIDMIKHLKFIPAYWMCADTTYTGHFIPAHIEGVSIGAFMDSTVEEIDFGINCKKISESACSGCNHLYKVTMHPALKSIGEHVFYGCEDLNEITFTGTQEQWLKIEKTPNWHRGAENLYIVSCTDGKVHI